jgi:membrane-associated phospholipid phosphatase
LSSNGTVEISDVQSFSVFISLASIFLIYAGMLLIVLVLIFIWAGKKIANRERPTNLLFLKRLLDMRSREHGKAMPSGDTFAAAYFCVIYYYIFNAHPFIFVCIPLAALGRVYTHCHWLGDTLVGAILGLVTTYYSVLNLYVFKVIFL